MKSTLKAIYLRLDSTSQTLSKSALAQMILKVIYYAPEIITKESIKDEVEGLLETNIHIDRVSDALELLLNEEKIVLDNIGYIINPGKKQNLTRVFSEYDERIDRIIENFFQPVDSTRENIRKWFENVTINYFSEYKSEWIAEKAYNMRPENSSEGLLKILDEVTKNDHNIVEKDKAWLKTQYLKFFNSQDGDVISIFWDYGMCAFSSSLIVSSTGADEISINSLRDSIFIIDTNILMYLTLEEDKYYDSYKALESIFIELGIKTGIFFITKEEYLRTMNMKKEQILRILDSYEEDVIDALDDPFIKTAKTRGCVTLDEYHDFFNRLMSVPDVFIEELNLDTIDNEKLNVIIEAGMTDETLINKLNEIYKSRHKYFQTANHETNKSKKDVQKKDKRKRALIHDAGIIRGIEHLREGEKAFIITRDITVKQYGINEALRDDSPISIGLDNLISMLAIDNGGINIDPANFKPLFANMIKLALVPEKRTFQLADLVTMIDIEQQISDLPTEEIISIAQELNRNRMLEVDDEKINLQLIRRYNQGKIKYKKEIDILRQEKESEKKEKDRFSKKANKATDALRTQIYQETRQKYEDKRFWSKIKFYLILPIAVTLLTVVAIYSYNADQVQPLYAYIIGLFSNLVVWIFTNFFFVRPRIRDRYITRINEIDNVVDRKVEEMTKE